MRCRAPGIAPKRIFQMQGAGRPIFPSNVSRADLLLAGGHPGMSDNTSVVTVAHHGARAMTMETNISHVLVVDEDPAVCKLVSEYLGNNDFRVTAVNTAPQVLEMLSREAIDILLMEPRLRGEDGLRLTRAIRDSSRLPIVMVSGRAEEADRVMALEFGADDYVTKPFSPRELLARIRAVLRRSQTEVACSGT